MRTGWGYLLPRDRLEGRYDIVKAPESTGEGQNARKKGKRRGSARVGDQFLLDLGQWRHFLPSVEEDPPGFRPDLETQKVVLPEKIKFREKRATWKVALGFED